MENTREISQTKAQAYSVRACVLRTQDEESEDDDDVPTGQSIGSECRAGARMYKQMCGRVKR